MAASLSGKLVLRCKASLLGDSTVGKSALTQVFHSDGTQFPKAYNMTIQAEMLVKTVNIPDTNVSIELFMYDMAGHSAFQEYLPQLAEGTAVWILVFDVSNQESFSNLSRWLDIAKSINHGKPFIGAVVGTKTDMATRRTVDAKHAEAFANSHGLDYFECSAANNENVEIPFYFLANAFHECYNDTLVKVSKIVEAFSG